MSPNLWAFAGVVVISVVTFGLGVWGSRNARTTSDFLVARRGVGEERNAAAISGEYLSAASFLGVAGLVLKDGVDALWYPVGFTAGYLALMLFVAAPLRRSGAYTLPDFAEARLDSTRVRWLATVFVVVIGWLYLVPQLQGAGLTLATISGQPYWVGVVAVAVIVLTSVLSGGMRAVTLVQAFQYWIKMFAISVPAFVLLLVFLVSQSEHRRPLDAEVPPVFEQDTTVRVTTDVELNVVEPVWLGTGDGGSIYLRTGDVAVPAGTEVRFPAGTPVPAVSDAEQTNAAWLQPQDGGSDELLRTYSLIIATFLGTMGLPHVLVRFYTNPSGHAARRTTLFVLLLLGSFYLFPTIFGLLSRFYVPQLLVTGKTDAAVLMLPSAMLDGWAGGLLGAVTAAGAFAAFLSTSSGLVVSVAGVLSTDVLKGRIRDFRVLALVASVVPTLLAVVAADQDISRSVELAFAMAASTFSPLLVMGVWWRGLTASGAVSGLLVGGGLVSLAVVLGLVSDAETGLWLSLVQQPALISVPAAFVTIVLVSKATKSQVPPRTSRLMLRLHAPDRLGFVEERIDRYAQQAPREPRHRLSGGRRLLRDRGSASHRVTRAQPERDDSAQAPDDTDTPKIDPDRPTDEH